MMKLQYGKQFATRAGSTWRLIFVTALMPWVLKCRVMTKTKIDDDDDILEVDLNVNLKKIMNYEKSWILIVTRMEL